MQSVIAVRKDMKDLTDEGKVVILEPELYGFNVVLLEIIIAGLRQLASQPSLPQSVIDLYESKEAAFADWEYAINSLADRFAEWLDRVLDDDGEMTAKQRRELRDLFAQLAEVWDYLWA